jgi:DNA invertase Pin-like site-specific DNA recombinase
MSRKLKPTPTPPIDGQVFGYARVSKATRESEGDSLDAQARKIVAYAAQHDLTVDATFVDDGVSGAIAIADRPQGAKLFAALRPGDSIIASKLDRMFRSALDALQVVEVLKAKGVKLHLLDAGGDVAGNGISKMFMMLAAIFAELERDKIRERILDAKADQRAQSRFLGGPRAPFGWRRVEEIDEAGKKIHKIAKEDREQKAIAEIIKLRRKGLSLRAIAAALQVKGFKIDHMSVGAVLKRQAAP